MTVLGPKERFGTASYAAIGVSSLKGHILPSQPLFQAKLHGHALLPAWLTAIENDAKVVIPQLKTGVVEPFFDLPGFAYLSERVFHGQFRGCLRGHLISAQEMRARNLGTSLLGVVPRGGFLYPGDLWFDPSATLDALEKAIQNRGGSILEGLVTRVIPQVGGGLEIEVANALGSPSGSHADRTLFKAREVVLAAGAFSCAILQQSGLPPVSLQLAPGETLDAPLDVQEGLNLRLGKTNYVAHGGMLRWGSTSRIGRDLSLEIESGGASPQGVESLWKEAHRYLNGAHISPARATVRWGIRTRVRDRAPVVGPLFWPHSRTQKLWVALGFYKNGLQLAGLLAGFLGDSLCAVPRTSFHTRIQALVHPDRLG